MLKKYVIERTAPGVGSSSKEDMSKMSGASNEVLSELGPHIQWNESFVTKDKIYCVYLAENEDIIREHARKGGFPVDRISEVVTIIDPSTASFGEASMGKMGDSSASASQYA